MSITQFAKKAEKLVTDNSPLILTAMGVSGVLATTYLTGTASLKAARIIDQMMTEEFHRGIRDNIEENEKSLTTKEVVSATWQLYIPAATTLTLTVASIIFANRIGTRRAAALAAAYSVSEKAYTEYKDKVVEQVGKIKEQKIRDDVAQDRVTNNPPSKSEIIVTGGGDVLFLDLYSGRYFQSTMEAVKKAQNDLNYQVLNNFYASLTDFYGKLGLGRITVSDDIGWNSDELLEINFSTTMSDDDRPCIAIDFAVQPIRDYYRVH